MIFKEFSFRHLAAVFVFALIFTALPARAQESGELQVVDEVVAQVNDGVITLSRVKREMRASAEAIAQQQRKPVEETLKELEGKRPELIANLITEELLIQEGKELGMEQYVEASLNQELTGLMKQLNLKTFEELYNAMRGQGVEPEEFKAAKRKELMKYMVIYEIVGRKIYNNLTTKEVQAYFAANKDKFKKPETVALSEIFLNYAGRNEAEVKAEAAEIVKKARGGADFTALVAQYSDRGDSKANKGSVGTHEVRNLNEIILNAIKNVKAGGVTDPIVQEDGIMIVRVDERVADSTTPVFDDRKVREVMATERLPAERKKYIADLRKNAYIKIAETYKTEVTAALGKVMDAN